jgi:hypothetical protein
MPLVTTNILFDDVYVWIEYNSILKVYKMWRYWYLWWVLHPHLAAYAPITLHAMDGREQPYLEVDFANASLLNIVTNDIAILDQ